MSSEEVVLEEVLEGSVRKEGEGEVEESPGMQFSPPVYRQRYLRVQELLEEKIPQDGKLYTVLEVGCAELSMHPYMSKLPRVGKLIYLDLDEGIIQENLEKLKPLIYEYLIKRDTPLRAEAYAGCVTKLDPNVMPDVHAVVGIEIVEHLDPPILAGFVKSIFGVIKPSLVILTTPNSEFNVFFNMEPGKFRHWDHRFEWTREEFKFWCKSVCESYPYYKFSIEGVGAGPPETEEFGCVSQLAIFQKVENVEENETERSEGEGTENCFKLLFEQDYPFFFDATPFEERILREFKSYVYCHYFTPSRIEEYENEEIKSVNISLEHLATIHGMPKGVTVDQLRSVFEDANHKIVEVINEFRNC